MKVLRKVFVSVLVGGVLAAMVVGCSNRTQTKKTMDSAESQETTNEEKGDDRSNKECLRKDSEGGTIDQEKTAKRRTAVEKRVMEKFCELYLNEKPNEIYNGNIERNIVCPENTEKTSDTKTTEVKDNSNDIQRDGSEENAKHTHHWTEVTTIIHHDAEYKTVHHEAVYQDIPEEGHWEEYEVVLEEAWDEPIYEVVKKYVCYCGEAFNSGEEWDTHAYWYVYNGTEAEEVAHSGFSYVYEDVLIGTTHHDAVTEMQRKWVVDKAGQSNVLVSEAYDEQVVVKPAYEETVITGYKCLDCGAIK